MFRKQRSGVIAKVGDHASALRAEEFERSIAAVETNGNAATAFKDPAHDVTAQHSPQSPNSESFRELASPAVSRRMLLKAPPPSVTPAACTRII